MEGSVWSTICLLMECDASVVQMTKRGSPRPPNQHALNTPYNVSPPSVFMGTSE